MTEDDRALLLRAVLATEGLLELARRGGATGGGGRAAQATGGGTPSGAVFPNYGRSKNQPVKGAAVAELEYYAAGAQRSLDDPGKARWHEKEQTLLDAINAELRRQSGGSAAPPPDFGPGDEDIPF